MGRFSPTVAPVVNDGLANALGNFTESYMQFSARKRQKDMDAIQTGVGLTPVDGSAPQSTPSGPLVSLRARLTGRTNPNDIATAVGNAAPAVQGANAVNAGVAENLSRSGDGSAPGFVARQPSGGGNYATNEAGSIPELPQQMRLPSGQIISTMMTPMGQRLMQARLAALGMGSEIRLRDSEVARNQREASRLQLGDPGYAAATGEVEGAKAKASLPADLAKLVAAGTISRDTALLVEQARAGNAASLQKSGEVFTAGENAKNRGAEADRQTAAKGEELSNKLTEIKATQAGQLGPNLVKAAKGFVNFGRIGAPEIIGGRKEQGSLGPLPGAKQPITTAERAQLKALGHTDADIQANYVVTDGH